jgi:hypothetical protein
VPNVPEAFRINSPNVVAETLDGETTIVNLESGTYYALNDTGSAIWDRVVAGSPEDRVASEIAEAYGTDAEVASAAVSSLLAELRDQELIVPGEGEGQAGAVASTNGNAPGAWSDPKLNTFTDMQELLLLDPIHEVDESGWPNQPAG